MTSSDDRVQTLRSLVASGDQDAVIAAVAALVSRMYLVSVLTCKSSSEFTLFFCDCSICGCTIVPFPANTTIPCMCHCELCYLNATSVPQASGGSGQVQGSR